MKIKLVAGTILDGEPVAGGTIVDREDGQDFIDCGLATDPEANPIPAPDQNSPQPRLDDPVPTLKKRKTKS